jgi:hypothetical protein
MGQFSTNEHDFGLVEYNSYHTVSIDYKGEHNLVTSNFKGTCGCTSLNYDSLNKRLILTLNMNSAPVKEANVICNIPEGQEIIKLKGTIK